MKEIIFVGRSNVGKSTLIRALTGIKVPVGKLPGVTRKPLHVPEPRHISDLEFLVR